MSPIGRIINRPFEIQDLADRSVGRLLFVFLLRLFVFLIERQTL